VNLLVFNLGMDADHSVLGHTTAWTNALARRCDSVAVIAMFTGRVAVEDNVTVYSLGKERGRSEARRLVEFYRLVRRVLDERRIDACFAHMAPLFAVLFAPFARHRRVPLLLWYAHPSVTPTLRMAYAAADRCVTPTPASFPLRGPKLFVVGHGIDTERFIPPARVGPCYESTAVAVGRVTPVKGLHEIVQAIAALRAVGGPAPSLEIVGGPATPEDGSYLASLRRSVASLQLDPLVTFRGPVPFQEMPLVYHRGRLSLNVSATAMDKALLESMAARCIPISRNPAFVELAHSHGLDELVPAGGPSGLADCIAATLRRGPEEREALGARMRRIVAEEHSLSTLSDRLMAHLTELVEATRARRAALG
jgi:glycosyltransferase involved in cell wall biosynthesis